MREEGNAPEFESLSAAGMVVVRSSVASLLHGAGSRRIRAHGQSEIRPEPCTHSLHSFVVHVSDLFGIVLVLVVLLLLLLSLLQEVFLQC